MADLEDKKVSQLESGTVTSNSVFLDSGNGVSTKVTSQDIANYVAKVQAYQGASGLVTLAKTLVGAINELANSAGKANFADLDDVDIDDETLDEGQVPIWDSTNEKWVNGEVNPVSAFKDLTDVDIDSQTLANGQVPVYNDTTQKWENGTVSGGASVIQKTMAEYTALPTSEKMNGSIYKITDKALIYCLDEEYHAVKEITSADYALLTSDEKNNGTLYIITDEETTADDIPYSAGVSVADMLDVKDVTNRFSVTNKSAGLSTFTVNSAYKYGNIMCVNLSYTITSGSIGTSEGCTLSSPYTPKYNVNGSGYNVADYSFMTYYYDSGVSIRRMSTMGADKSFSVNLIYVLT